MNKSYYLKDKQFIIEDYDKQKPFASFLPGIAGLDGIPMWVYYTNRGQGIAGFGIENKNGSILDFVPANKSYIRTENAGYRTFIKKSGLVHELFTSLSSDQVKRQMIIENNSVGFVEENSTLDIKATIKYFTVTSEKFPGLIRKVTLESISGVAHEVELVDGLMTLWPYGTTDDSIKNMANLVTAWFDTYNSENNLPFYRNRASSNDSAEVSLIEAGHFYASYVEGNNEPLKVIYDAEVLFGQNTNNTKPWQFEAMSVEELLEQPQVSANKIPCAYSALKLEVKEPVTLHSIVGKMNHIDELNETASAFTTAFFNNQEVIGEDLAASLLKDVEGVTNYPVFDAYVKQSYFDNLLRGGYPIVFEGKKEPIVYHVYSRIHGDMEREYNQFLVEPAYYSQGIGNFRDVNQNRRNDIYFNPEAGYFNIKQFMSFIQLDGQNPLSIRGSHMTLETEAVAPLLKLVENNAAVVEEILKKPFTPGELMTSIDTSGVILSVEPAVFLEKVLKESTQEIKATFGEGYWVDHWTYNMDLVDNFLNIYPDQVDRLLFEDQYRYYRSPATVLKREDKYVLTDDGRVRQYEAVLEDENRIHQLGIDETGTNWETNPSGDLVTSNLFEKLLTLIINKVSNADPSGIGIMMNTDKPGWNDAMNGLPGLFGSGSSEVVELRRIVTLLRDSATEDRAVTLPSEMVSFAIAYKELLEAYNKKSLDNLSLYEQAQTLKEHFDDQIYMGTNGEMKTIVGTEVVALLTMIDGRLDEMIERAKAIGDGILPSYFIHEAVDYDVIEGKCHPITGVQNVKVNSWTYRALPLYLEAPARYLKQVHSKEVAEPMYHKIKASGMYDEKLKMYITSESLEEESLEIGRARAFVAGWLERESVFMHMSYKYLLGMLKSGMYEEYFDAIKTAFPPFMDPAVYGRSTLENSSFIASSRNPNPNNHGRGFVSRLTGTTSELVTMWLYIMSGMKLFTDKEGSLTFGLRPSLPADFFNESNEVKFTLFGCIEVTYKNPEMKDTFGETGVSPVSYKVTTLEGETFEATEVSGDLAHLVRDRKVKSVEVLLG